MLNRQTSRSEEGSAQQLGLLRDEFTWEQEFALWKATPFGRHLLRHIYRTAAFYGDRYRRTGRRVSMKLVFELVRDRLPWIKSALVKRGIKPTTVLGFALNNNFTAPAARHVMERRPDWNGMFQLKALGDQTVEETVIVKRRVVSHHGPLSGQKR